MKIDMERAMSSFGLNVGGSGQFGQSAAEQLRMLRAVSGDVSEEGHEQVAGTETTHYSATVDMRRYPEVMPEEQREAARRARRAAHRADRAERGPDGRLDRRRRAMDVTAEYMRFGVPVDIDVPDDGDVFEATDLVLRGLEQAQP